MVNIRFACDKQLVFRYLLTVGCNVCSGQESAGIVMGHGDNAHKYEQHRAMGLVTNIFSKEVLMKLKGNLGIGNIVMFLNCCISRVL